MEGILNEKAPVSNALERKAWNRVFEDGLWDLYLGVLFLNAVAWMIAAETNHPWGDTGATAVIVLLLAWAGFQVAKRRITAPRLGYFKLGRKRTSKLRLGGVLTVAVTLALLAITVLGGKGAFSEDVPLTLILFGVLAIMGVLMFGISAYFTGVERLYLYGALMLVGFLGAEALVAKGAVDRGWDIVAMFGLPALAMMPVGLALLVRFLRRYPAREA